MSHVLLKYPGAGTAVIRPAGNIYGNTLMRRKAEQIICLPFSDDMFEGNLYTTSREVQMNGI